MEQLHLPQDRRQLVEALRLAAGEWVRRRPGPVAVTLFGSVAAGTCDTRSDVDLVVVRPDSLAEDDPRWESMLDSMTARLGELTDACPGVFTLCEHELAEQLSDPASVFCAAAVRGIPLAGPPLAHYASGPVRFDAQAARRRRHAWRCESAAHYLESLRHHRDLDECVAHSLACHAAIRAADAWTLAAAGRRCRDDRLHSDIAALRAAHPRLADALEQAVSDDLDAGLETPDVERTLRLAEALLNLARSEPFADVAARL